MAKLIVNNTANSLSLFICSTKMYVNEMPGDIVYNSFSSDISMTKMSDLIDGLEDSDEVVLRGDINEISVLNSPKKLIIKGCYVPLKKLTLTGESILHFTNSYQYNQEDELMDVTVGKSSSVIMDGLNIKLGIITLQPLASLNVSLGDLACNITNTDPILIKNLNIPKLLDLSLFLKKFDFSKQDLEYPLKDMGALRLYKTNQEVVEPILKTLNVNTSELNNYISSKFFEVYGISRSVEGSFFEHIPVEVVGKISTFLDPSDIEL